MFSGNDARHVRQIAVCPITDTVILAIRHVGMLGFDQALQTIRFHRYEVPGGADYPDPPNDSTITVSAFSPLAAASFEGGHRVFFSTLTGTLLGIQSSFDPYQRVVLTVTNTPFPLTRERWNDIAWPSPYFGAERNALGEIAGRAQMFGNEGPTYRALVEDLHARREDAGLTTEMYADLRDLLRETTVQGVTAREVGRWIAEQMRG